MLLLYNVHSTDLIFCLFVCLISDSGRVLQAFQKYTMLFWMPQMKLKLYYLNFYNNNWQCNSVISCAFVLWGECAGSNCQMLFIFNKCSIFSFQNSCFPLKDCNNICIVLFLFTYSFYTIKLSRFHSLTQTFLMCSCSVVFTFTIITITLEIVQFTFQLLFWVCVYMCVYILLVNYENDCGRQYLFTWLFLFKKCFWLVPLLKHLSKTSNSKAVMV